MINATRSGYLFVKVGEKCCLHVISCFQRGVGWRIT